MSERFHPAGPIRIVGKQVWDELDQGRTRHAEKDKATREAIGGMRSARDAIRKLPKWTTAAASAEDSSAIRKVAKDTHGVLGENREI